MLEVFTIGGGEYLVNTFNAVAAWTGGGGYRGLLRVVMVMGLIYALLIVAFSLNWRAWFNWFLQSTLIYLCLMVPTVDIKVTDRINPSLAPATVGNVPLGLGVMASFTSQVGDWLTRTAETVFVMPATLQYSTNGFIYGSKLLDATRSVEITDPIFAANLNEHIKQCVFYDVMLGFKSMSTLASSSDLWGSFGPGSPARGQRFMIDAGGGATTTEIRTCQQSYATLDQQWTAAVLPSESLRFARETFPRLVPAAALAKMNADLPETLQAFTGLSNSALQTLRQSMTINAFLFARADMSGSTGEASTDSFAVGRSDLQARNTYNIVAQNAMKWVPLLHIVMTVLFYALFPVLFPLFLFPRSGVPMLKGYTQGFFYLASWGPILVILHMILMTRGTSAGVALTDGSGITLATIAGIGGITDDLASIAGYMMMSVPVLAYMVARGGMSFGSNAASALAPLGSASEAASVEATTGNYSYGNVNYAMRMGNKSDFTPSYADGAPQASFRGSNGVINSFNADGSQVINQAPGISSFERKFSFTDGEVAEMREGASMFQAQAESARQSASQSFNAATQTGTQLFNTMQTSHGRDTVTGRSEQESISQASSIVQNMSDRLVKEYGWNESTARAVAAEAFSSGSLGADARAALQKKSPADILSGSVGVGGDYTQGARHNKSWTSNASASENIQKGLDLVDNVSRSDTATTARENFFRATSTSSDSAIRGLTERRDASLTEARNFELQASRSEEQGRRYEQQASYAQTHGLQASDDLSQSRLVFQQRELAANPALAASGYHPSLLDHQLTPSQRRVRDALDNRFAAEYLDPIRDIRDGIQPLPSSRIAAPPVDDAGDVQRWGRGQMGGLSASGPDVTVGGDARDARITSDVRDFHSGTVSRLDGRSSEARDYTERLNRSGTALDREADVRQDRTWIENLPAADWIRGESKIDGAAAARSSGVGIKSGVKVASLDASMGPAIQVVAASSRNLGLTAPVITSGRDGVHSPTSVHPDGKALDFRGHNLTGSQGRALAASVSRRLGPDYDVQFETFPSNPARNHLHVEFDPKREKK